MPERDAPGQKRPRPSLGVIETAPADRARVLYEEARAAAREHLAALSAAIAAVRDLCLAVVDGGDLYAPGLRDLAGRLAEDLFWKTKTLAMLLERQAD